MKWWMIHHGALTFKRQKGYSNCKWVGRLDLGKLTLQDKKRANDGKIHPARNYMDNTGKKRWCGTSELKQTQPGPQCLEHVSSCLCHSNDATTT